MTIAAETLTLTPSAMVELYVIDLTPLGAPVLRYAPQTNALGGPVVWQGQTYQPYPIEARGFAATTDGPAPRPTLRVSNVLGQLGALVAQHGDLIGGRFVRRRTRARFLDAINFPGGVNPTANPTAQYADDVWSIDRLAHRDLELIEWELCSPIDLEGAMVPKRQLRRHVCTSRYRSPECGYAGGPVAKADDSPTSVLAEDRCSLRTSGCKLRFGATGELPIGIFPGAGLLRQQ
jgi:lambda family phage minor tail protein L